MTRVTTKPRSRAARIRAALMSLPIGRCADTTQVMSLMNEQALDDEPAVSEFYIVNIQLSNMTRQLGSGVMRVKHGFYAMSDRYPKPERVGHG